MPRGGARPGAGRKPKDATLAWLGGHAGKRAPVQGKRPTVAPFPLLAPPKGLTPDAVAVWHELAPQACEARTLTDQTAGAFALLCKHVVLERRMFAILDAEGLTEAKVTLQMDASGGGVQSVEKKPHALLSNYRGISQRVEAGLTRFCLTAMGKELRVAEPEADEWEEFDQPTPGGLN